MYSQIFESIIPKNNAVLYNRNRSSHPYTLFTDEALESNAHYKTFRFYLILIGKSVKYLPYVYAALLKAGKAGLDRDRISFTIDSVTVDNGNILQDDLLISNTPDKIWHLPEKTDISGEIFIRLLTPLRFKVKGQYTTAFSPLDFFLCLFRRQSVLCHLYGEHTEEKYYFPVENIVMENAALTWADSKHYSSRQKDLMNLGGIVGTFTLKGQFSETELGLLEFAKIFGAGKNTNFGLGRLDYRINRKENNT